MMSSEDLDSKRHRALALLKPMCIALMQKFSSPEAKSLQCAVKDIERNIIQEILQYLLFPIQNALHLKSLTESELCEACSALDAILQKAVINKTQLFYDVLDPLILLLSSPENLSQVCVRSEEVKEAILTSLTSLFKSSDDSVLKDVYSLKFLPVIGQIITLVLSVAECEKSRTLQVISLDCLMAILQTDTSYGSRNEVELGDFFAFCLPGVSMATTRIMTGDQKQGVAVIRKTISAFARIVHMSLADALLEKSEKRRAASSGSPGILEDERLKALKIHRDADWMKKSASKVRLLLDKVCGLKSHSSWKVRAALVEALGHLLTTCGKSLQECVPTILDCLVALVTDDYTNVAKKASGTLQAFSATQKGSDGERTLREILEENLHALVTSLPRKIRMSDEDEKPVLIKQLKGYILLLDSNVNSVVNSTPHLNRLALALVQSLEMETDDVKVMEERQTLLDFEADTFYSSEYRQVWKPRRYFKHFREESVLAELVSVCQLLGRHGNVMTLVDHFLDLYAESENYRLAAVLVINEIVCGAGQRGQNHSSDEGEVQKPFITSPTEFTVVQDTIRMLLDEYTSRENLRLIDFSSNEKATSSQSGDSLTSSLMVWRPDKADKTLSRRNRSILLLCLFMEGMGKFAEVLHENFTEHLIRTLYPLVENLGHENVHISSTAYLTLTQVCSACGYSSLDHLMQANADYLLNSVSLRLRHLERNQRTPRVLSVMLRYCSQDLLPLIDHSITEILDSLDDHYSDHLVLFMPVLQELTTAIGRWFPRTQSNAPVQSSSRNPAPATSRDIDPRSVVAFVEDFARQRKIMDGDFTDEEVLSGGQKDKERTLNDIGEDMENLVKERRESGVVGEEDKMQGEEESEEEGEKDGKCPKHIQVVKEILQRIKNLLSSKDARIRVQALEIVSQACLDLAGNERELLPEIHQLWPGFYPRFHSDEKFIVIKALQTLKAMAEVSGSFIQQRVIKDVLPGLAQFMENQSKISNKSHSAYLYTNNFKLQQSVLNTIGPLAQKLSLDGTRLQTAVRMCLPYLSDLQPLELQKACREAFSHFILLDADALWLFLCRTYCPVDLHPPVSGEFHKLVTLQEPRQRNEFTENITEIFSSFYS